MMMLISKEIVVSNSPFANLHDVCPFSSDCGELRADEAGDILVGVSILH